MTLQDLRAKLNTLGTELANMKNKIDDEKRSATDEEKTTLLALLTRVVEGNEAYAKPGNGRRRPRRGATAPDERP